MGQTSISFTQIKKISGAIAADAKDILAIEEPLEIRLLYRVGEDRDRDRVTKSISVTMRTPGNDPELAIGFIFTEGILKSVSDVLYG